MAAGRNDFEHLPGVCCIDPQLPVATPLEHEVAGSAHHPSVITSDTGGGLVLPDRSLRDRIPGADQFADQLLLARAHDRFAIGQRSVQTLQVGRVVGVVGHDAVAGEETIEISDGTAVMRHVDPYIRDVEHRYVH